MESTTKRQGEAMAGVMRGQAVTTTPPPWEYGELDRLGLSVAEPLSTVRPPWVIGSMSVMDAAFLAGLVMAVRPRKVIEVGVATGWGSVNLLAALERAGCDNYDYIGIDLSERLFRDKTFATGQAVEEFASQAARARYRLRIGRALTEIAPEIGAGIDFVFLDANHMHPWPTLELLALLPWLEPETWVSLHDISLSMVERFQHKNRGPKYLFDCWRGAKLHSIENPPMAGAIQVGEDTSQYLVLLLDALYTPWEQPVDRRFLVPLLDSMRVHFGAGWSAKFEQAFDCLNPQAADPHRAGRLSRCYAGFRQVLSKKFVRWRG